MHDPRLPPIVQTAFLRSLGLIPRNESFPGGMIFFIGENSFRAGESALRGKAVVLGPPPPAMLPGLGIRKDRGLPLLEGSDACAPAQGERPYTESPAFLAYAEHELAAGVSSSLRRRPFTRFDYSDEWNNLGFGRVRADGSIWAAHGGFVTEGAAQLAGIFTRTPAGDQYCGAYLTLFDSPEASLLWCSRPVGPLDSTEWTVIERFVCDWRAEDMPCLPCLRQIPAPCRCLVTMRLDCDEDVASARDLFEWYRKEGIPFSLAVKSSLELGASDLALLEAARAAGGTLLSHSHAHQPDWGATPEEAQKDAQTSRNRFAGLWPSFPPPDLAVSPFHTNPPYAVQAMARAGFTGFVSGIIHNDPEYLLGRAGTVPFAGGRMVSISQQSMLHGDCRRRQGEGMEVHIAAFEAQYVARGIFGYLDHPFSERYQYDWESRQQRLQAHQRLVAAMRRYQGVWFWSQQQCFDFVRARAAVRLRVTPGGRVAVLAVPERRDIAYRYKGQEYALSEVEPG
ncbi:MAG: hypothetical protein LBJ14_07115 [Desulfarculales bacterium]|jgi:hypothetical protein|nr:hypothetical protein [Desulfarculales bacterium]